MSDKKKSKISWPHPLKRVAYNVIRNHDVGWQTFATPKQVMQAIINPTTIEDDNKYMFLYGPEALGRKEVTSTNSYNWDNDIKENKYKNVKSYEGVLNPYNEYLFNERDRGLIEELAKHRYTPLSNINDEYRDEVTDRIYPETPYFDDVHSYRLRFHYKDGKPVISSSDLYDFGKNYTKDFSELGEERSGLPVSVVKPVIEVERRLLNAVGQPYLLRQENIPIRFVDNPQGSEIYRVNNLTSQILDTLTNEDIARITESGYIVPAVISNKRGGILKRK